MKGRLIAVILVLLIASSSIPLLFILLEKPEVDRYERNELTIDVDVRVKNQGSLPAQDIPLRLALPRDGLEHQNIISSELSFEPDRYSNDTWGNRFIHYKILQLDAGESFNLTMSFDIELFSIDLDINEAGGGEIEEDLSPYLLESALINSNDPTIIHLAKEIADESEDITDIAWNSYEWILDNIYYQQVPGEWDAVTTLRNGEGASAEMANLFVALLRANGIPARRVSGWGNNFEIGEELALTRFSHGWADFYVAGIGWVQVDPAWGKTSKFDNFARTDEDHVILTKGAGIKYLWRGPYSSPFGDTEVNTDYQLTIKDIKTENLSPRRDIIKWSFLSYPVIFGIFVMVQVFKRRKI